MRRVRMACVLLTYLVCSFCMVLYQRTKLVLLVRYVNFLLTATVFVNSPHFCETQVYFMVYLLAVVMIVMGSSTFGAVISTLGRFLHSEVCK